MLAKKTFAIFFTMQRPTEAQCAETNLRIWAYVAPEYRSANFHILPPYATRNYFSTTEQFRFMQYYGGYTLDEACAIRRQQNRNESFMISKV
jgi:hypothetical protein